MTVAQCMHIQCVLRIHKCLYIDYTIHTNISVWETEATVVNRRTEDRYRRDKTDYFAMFAIPEAPLNSLH